MAARKKILIVDDDVNGSEIRQIYLEETGLYEVQLCHEGRRAAEAAKAFRPDLILLDVIMPDREGTEVVLDLQKDPDLKQVAVYFMTSLVSRAKNMEPVQIAGYPSIPKTIDRNELVEQIGKIFSS